MSEASRTGSTGRSPSSGTRPGPALPKARLKFGQLWLEVDRYPQPEEAQRLARSAIPQSMELGRWSLSPVGERWSLFVHWQAPDRASAASTKRPSTQ